jgi:two-component sensor histidine kinase
MIVLTFALALTQFAFDYRNVMKEGEERARAYAVSMATDVRWYLGVARQVLKRVETQTTDLYRGSPNTLREAVQDLPAGVVIVAYDQNGQSTEFLNYAPGNVDISDRGYFNQLKDGSSWVISHVISDRVTGEQTFAVGHAILRDGAFAGAVVAYAPMQVFNTTWLSMGGKDSNAFIVHEDGGLTARIPTRSSEVFDRPLPEDFVAQFFSAERGAYAAEASPIDGIKRVVGWARVDGEPLVAAIGISTDELLKGFWAKVFTTLAVLAPISGLLGYAAFRNSQLIHKQESTAQALESSVRQNEILFQEIHHRVKNNLQSVLSLVSLHSKSSDPVSEIRPRIQAMVAVHEHIYRTDSYVEVPAPAYIAAIARQIVEASSTNVRLETDVLDMLLPHKAVMPLGQLIGEAVINAIKYGYPDGRPGVIAISLRPDEADQSRLRLTIHNDGVPMPEQSQPGMGTRLTKAFAAQLGGDVRTVSDAGGVSVEATFPRPA